MSLICLYSPLPLIFTGIAFLTLSMSAECTEANPLVLHSGLFQKQSVAHQLNACKMIATCIVLSANIDNFDQLVGESFI